MIGWMLITQVQAHGLDGDFDSLEHMWPTANTVRTSSGLPGSDYWQQQADYEIHVTLDETERHITGHETIRYVNNSPDTLHYLWMQLDPNFLSNSSERQRMQTAPHMALEGASMNVETIRRLEKRLDYDPQLEIRNIQINGQPAKNIIQSTMMKVSLPTPLESGESLNISMDWNYTLNDASVLWARSGYEVLDDNEIIFEIAQFYPRMAIYSDQGGWLTKPYLGTGEFATEFGNYDVYITVPKDHIVGATGTLQNPEDVLSEKQQRRLEAARTSAEPIMVVKPIEAEHNRLTAASQQKTWHYQAKNVRDFAWGSSRTFIWDAWGREIDGQTVMAMSYYPAEGMPLWDQYSTHAVAHTLEFYSKMVFPYPYPVAISMNGPIYGMEYPMLSFNGPRPLEDGTYYNRTGPWRHQKQGLISVIIHEVGHNWFPMIVNNDERSWIWMDEGLNTYVQTLAELEWSEKYEPKRGEPSSISGYMASTDDVPIMTDADSVTSRGNNAYAKPAAALNLLRYTVVGPELFDDAFSHYSTQWAFKRPYPADFFRSIEDASGSDLDWFWRAWFYGTNHVDLALENVQVFRADDPDPTIHKPRKQLQRKEDTIPTKRRQDGEQQTQYADRFPSVLDFYDSYDEFDVTDDDIEAFNTLLADLEDDLKPYMHSKMFYNKVNIQNITGMPTPVLLRITYQDQQVEDIHIPADIWRKYPESFSQWVIREQPIIKVEIDPLQETADHNLQNNVFPPTIESSYFQTTPSDSLPSNPMQNQDD